MTTPIVTAAEAAEILRVHPDTVRRWCEDGTLEAKRIGRPWVIDRESVLKAKYQKFFRYAARKTKR